MEVNRRTGKIDESELGSLFAARVLVDLSQRDDEHGVRARRFRVHVGCRLRAMLLALVEDFHNLLVGRHVHFGHVLDVHAKRVLANFQVVRRVGRQQIANALVVNFDVGQLHREFDALLRLFDASENVLHQTRNDTPVRLRGLAHHRVAFLKTRKQKQPRQAHTSHATGER